MEQNPSGTIIKAYEITLILVELISSTLHLVNFKGASNYHYYGTTKLLLQFDWSTQSLPQRHRLNQSTMDHSATTPGPIYVFRECKSHRPTVFKAQLAIKSDIQLGNNRRVSRPWQATSTTSSTSSSPVKHSFILLWILMEFFNDVLGFTFVPKNPNFLFH